MWFFGLIFWLVLPLFFMAIALRRWRWRRWAMIEGRGLHPHGWDVPSGWPARRAMERGGWEKDPEESQRQQAHIDALENRLAGLEERLDFTERLLEGRGKKAAGG